MLDQATRLLANSPLDWGDPLSDYRHLNLRLYRGSYGWLIVNYAVDEARRVVYIRSIQPYPGSALGADKDATSGNGPR
jgi:hypothetical protein